jgi:hypothetical protein
MADTDALERELVLDLNVIGDMAADDSFYDELYRGLAGVRWTLDGEHITLSWKRAEEVVNVLRGRHGHDPKAFAQTGGEGEVSERVARALDRWTASALDTSRHDDAHIDSPRDVPERGGGHRKSE